MDLYVFNDQMVQGYRGVHIDSRHNEESLGEMYRKDDIEVSNQDLSLSRAYGASLLSVT